MIFDHPNDALRSQIRLGKRLIPLHACEQMITFLSNSAVQDAPLSGGVDKKIRNALICISDEGAALVNSHLQRIVDQFVEPLYQIHVDYWEAPQLIAYPPGGFFRPHNDCEDIQYDEITSEWNWRRVLDRDISVVCYLNDDFDGGELVFPMFELSIRPEAGMVVTFPSSHDFAHSAQPVTRGTRYVAVTWIASVGTPRVQSTPPPRVLNQCCRS